MSLSTRSVSSSWTGWGDDGGGGVESSRGNGSGGAMIPFTECVIYIWERINLLLMKKTSTRSWACFLCCCSSSLSAGHISHHKLFRLCFSHCVIWLRPARMTEWVKHDNGKAGEGERERERGIWSGSAKNKPHIRKSLTVIVDQWIGALSQRPFYRVDGGKTGRAMARVHVFLSTAWSHRWTHGDSMRLRKDNISHFKLIYDPPVNTGLPDSHSWGKVEYKAYAGDLERRIELMTGHTEWQECRYILFKDAMFICGELERNSITNSDFILKYPRY